MDDGVRMLGAWLADAGSEEQMVPDPSCVEAVYDLLDDWKHQRDVISALCLRLFGCYRATEVEAKVFTLQFFPSLIHTYLNGIALGEKKDVGISSIQTLLLAVYNLEAGEEAQKPKTKTFRVPNIAQPSVYHEPSGLASSALTESALRRLDPANRITVKFGPLPHLHTFNAENRLAAIAALLRIYLEYLSMFSKTSLIESCLAFSRLATQSYPLHQDRSPRIPLSSQVLVQVLRIVYSLTMEEGELALRAQQALQAVEQRAQLELAPAAMLMCSALSDSAKLSIKGVRSTSQLLSSTTSLSSANSTGPRAMWKSMITNASFRTKKLPEDITVADGIDHEQSATAAAAAGAAAGPAGSTLQAPPLTSITEENDEQPTSGVGKSSFRLSELGHFAKKKDKVGAKQPDSGKDRSAGGRNSVKLKKSSEPSKDWSHHGDLSLPVTDSNGDADKEDVAEIKRRSVASDAVTQV